MKVTGPTVTVDRDIAVWQCQVTLKDGRSRPLFYSVPSEHRDLLTDRIDAALVGLIIPAMDRGEDLHLEGPVSVDLLHQVQTDYAYLLTLLYDTPGEVKVSSEEVASMTAPASGVATGFSGGVDSFSTLADHYFSNIPDSLRISHLLFNNVGSHGLGGERLFRQRYERLIPVAEKLNLPFIPVNSNLDSFNEYGFELNEPPRNASVPLLLQQGIGRFLHSSAYPYPEVGVHSGSLHAATHADPITLPLLSTSRVRMFPAGVRYTRSEKTMQIAELPLTHTSLDVCVSLGRSDSGPPNCSACWKCLRTLLTLEIGGVLDRYEAVFDLDIYRRRREWYMASVLASRDSLSRDILAFARARGFSFPSSARALAPLALASPILKRHGRQLAPEWIKNRARSIQQNSSTAHYPL